MHATRMISRGAPTVDIELTTFENLHLDTPGSMTRDDRDRPAPTRSSTDPSTMTLSQLTPTLAPPRSRSPYSRSHLRSRSSGSYLAPSMLRTHSMPSVDAAGHLTTTTSRGRPSSPLGSSSAYRPAFRRNDEDLKPSRSSGSDDAANYKGESGLLQTPPGLYLNAGNAFPRRRRPSSPLQQVAQVSASGAFSSTSSSASSSPLIGPAKFNESYPTNYPSSFSSSVSSTPTSPRSRSPSISSLETIPDSPDAEEEALEAERIAKLKAAADAADGGQNDGLRDNLDIPSSGRSGSGYGSRERKRWSVCGGERRGDLDLETIYEV
ncbi:MAG: hypothetical protein M1819_005808 [Sarea resinae]|nr:MAG: hypothetical protein M1819_005808 [Sarea resinae]